jgi:hypothetical protein
MIALAIVFIISLLASQLPRGSDFDARLGNTIGDHVFSIAAWEWQTLTQETLPALVRRGPVKGDSSLVIEYFSAAERGRTLERLIRQEGAAAAAEGQSITVLTDELEEINRRQSEIRPTVERVLERQIRETAAEQGIHNPLSFTRLSFPPVDFKLSSPPNILVISPRDRIESMKEKMLQPGLTAAEMESIETQVDGMDVSSMVTGIGGLAATYPAFVADGMSLRQTINAATEEWLHQYLVFRPLGLRYLLDITGVSPDYEIACMNETLAGIVSKEVGALIYEEYYEPGLVDRQVASTATVASRPAIDFNAEMRQIRQTVDELLAAGEIEGAEAYMDERRDYLASNGYYIRKLNQAYFAFYGAYTDSPTSVDPIGTEMRRLRSDSDSLKEFLDLVSGMAGREDLSRAVAEIAQDPP